MSSASGALPLDSSGSSIPFGPLAECQDPLMDVIPTWAHALVRK